MIGRLQWSGKRLLRLRVEEERMMGLRLVTVELPGDSGERNAGRYWSRGLEMLRRMGVRQVLPPKETGHPLPEGMQVPTRDLWQTLSVPLALDVLDRAGARREQAVVGISGDRVTPHFWRCCWELSHQVRGLSLDVSQGADSLIWRLERNMGIPVFRGGGDVNLQFTPHIPLCGQNIRLYPRNPKPEGYDILLKQGGEPEGVERLPLLAVLLEQGKVSREDLRLCHISRLPGHTAGEVMKMTDPFDELEKDGKTLPIELMPNCSDVASATECTGLMPTLPQNEDEEESYQELFSMEIPKKSALENAEKNRRKR